MMSDPKAKAYTILRHKDDSCKNKIVSFTGNYTDHVCQKHIISITSLTFVAFYINA